MNLASCDLNIVLYLLREFIFEIENNPFTVYSIDCMPFFVYTPILSFERGRNQQGLFLYQAFTSTMDDVYNLPFLIKQEISCSFSITIKNKKNILHELDVIGINRKFLYSDFDSMLQS